MCCIRPLEVKRGARLLGRPADWSVNRNSDKRIAFQRNRCKGNRPCANHRPKRGGVSRLEGCSKPLSAVSALGGVSGRGRWDRLALPTAAGAPAEGSRNDSEMAPQVVGIARNGLGNGHRPFAVAAKENRSGPLRITWPIRRRSSKARRDQRSGRHGSRTAPAPGRVRGFGQRMTDPQPGFATSHPCARPPQERPSACP
jgi:hypothetical protein